MVLRRHGVPKARLEVLRQVSMFEGLPTKAEAERIGTRLLGEVGLRLAETSGVRVDDGFSTWFVSAAPMVGGLPVVGMDWSVGVGADGCERQGEEDHRE